MVRQEYRTRESEPGANTDHRDPRVVRHSKKGLGAVHAWLPIPGIRRRIRCGDRVGLGSGHTGMEKRRLPDRRSQSHTGHGRRRGGTTTLRWTAPNAQIIEVHVGSPSGALLTHEGNRGSVTTGAWVTDGATFYLQDVTGGKPLTADNTMATAVVHLQQK